MAHEIVVWCDIHLQRDDKRIAATANTVTVNGESFSVDMCDTCVGDVLAPLARVLREYGAAVKGKAAKPQANASPAVDPFAVPDNGKTDRAYARAATDAPTFCFVCTYTGGTEGALFQHYRTQHPVVKRVGTEALYGTQCPVCGYNTAGARYLTQHGMTTHGAANAALLFGMGRRDGDPHGVIATRVRKVKDDNGIAD